MSGFIHWPLRGCDISLRACPFAVNSRRKTGAKHQTELFTVMTNISDVVTNSRYPETQIRTYLLRLEHAAPPFNQRLMKTPP
jgi:hypothetical protein